MAHVTLTQPLQRLLLPSFILDYDGAVRGTPGDGVQLQCWLENITPEVSEGGAAATFCQPFERTWTLSAKMTWELHSYLKPMENQNVLAATLRDSTIPPDPDNIEESFTLAVPSIPSAISGGIRSINAIDLEFIQVDDSTFANNAGAAVTTHPV